MNIFWESFTPWTSLGGGLLIGLAAALMVALMGRIMGISGIAGGLLQAATWARSADWGWRAAFVLGLVAAPLLWQVFAPLPEMDMPSGQVMVVIAGLLVGFGTRLGSGCTSGHGVCGLSRLSLRSLAATLTFIAAGAAVVFVQRHALGGLSMLSTAAAGLAGLVFGLGLLLSGMGNPAKVQNFLDFFGRWDPSLAFVMGGAIAVGLPVFAWAKRRRHALLGQSMQLPAASAVDTRLLTGAALFGAGWGLAGFCPGPAVMSLATLQPQVWLFVAAMLAGMALHRLVDKPH